MTRAAEALAEQPTPVGALDCGRLTTWLNTAVPGIGGALRIEPASGGMSNPTYFLSRGDWQAVLRKQPAGLKLSKSAHRVDREYRVLQALHGSNLPAPRPIAFCEDAEVVGTPFYLMERLQGRVLADGAMPGLPREERAACYFAMAEAMAALHGFDFAAAGLGDFGRPEGFFERQIAGWAEQWERLRTPDNPHLDPLIDWLRANIPPGRAAAVCHGDFRLANIMFHPSEPRVVGVFDWELSTIGHPLADVAFSLQPWLLAPEHNGGVAGLDLDVLGIPSQARYLERYYARRPDAERLSPFHVAFAMFRASVGVAGVAARGAAGASLQSGMVEEAWLLSLAYAQAASEAAGLDPTTRPRPRRASPATLCEVRNAL